MAEKKLSQAETIAAARKKSASGKTYKKALNKNQSEDT